MNRYEKKPIDEIKDTTFNSVLIIIALLAIPLLAFSTFRTITTGWKIAYLLHIIIVGAFYVLYLLRKKINLPIKTFILAGLLLSAAIIGLSSFGFIGSGRLFFIPAIMMISLFIGRKHAYILIALTLIVVSIFAYLFITETMSYDFNIVEYINKKSVWISYGFTFAMVILIILSIVNKYEDSLLKVYKEKILQETHYQSLFEQAADGIIICDKKGDVLMCNKSFCYIIGYSFDEIINKNLSSIFSEEVLKKNPFRYDLLEKSEIVTNERQAIKKDGSKIYLESRSQKLIDGRLQIFIRDITGSKKNREEIRYQKEFNEKILEVLPGIFFMYEVTHDKLKLAQWNKNHETILGYNSTELKGQPPFYFVNPKDHNKVIEAINSVTKKKDLPFEASLIHGNGNSSPFYITSRLFETDERNYILGVCIDLSEKKKAEIELLESEEKLRTIINNVPSVVYRCLMDEHWTMKMISPRIKKISGYPQTDFINNNVRTYSSIIHPNYIDYVEEVVLDSVKKKEPFTVEYKIIDKYYKTQWVLEKGRAHYNDKGEVDWLDGVITDITERKKIESALLENEEKFRNIFNNTSDAILIIDYDFNILTANNTFLTLMGVDKNMLSKINMFDYIVDENARELVIERIHQLELGKTSSYEYNIRDTNNRIFPVESRGNIIKFEGKPAILSTFNDISKRKNLEKEVYAASVNAEETERGRLAKELHDGLGPLLSTCRIYLHQIKSSDSTNETESIESLEELINEAITGIKEISNNISPHILRNFGLVHAIKSFIEKIKSPCKIFFNCDCLPNERYNELIEITIYRVLTELINNTIKYAQANTVNIDIIKKDNLIQIHYIDDGKGFDYKKVRESSKGFGLLNIQTRIKSIGGVIKFNSSPGKGVFANIQIKIQ